jgi:hypothetical protein
MSRRGGNSASILEHMIDTYKESKDKENALKKSNTILNDTIKTYMADHDLTKANTEKYTATVSVTNKESLNEDLAIEIIKSKLDGPLLTSVIKQKEYIDEDALEKLIYNGDFDAKDLVKAKIVKSITTLRISKRKDV